MLSHASYGDLWSVRQDKLDLVKSRPAPPVLDGICPAAAGITKAVEEYHGRRVPLDGREQQRGPAQ